VTCPEFKLDFEKAITVINKYVMLALLLVVSP